jgi:hypothetical protein
MAIFLCPPTFMPRSNAMYLAIAMELHSPDVPDPGLLHQDFQPL